MPATRTLSVRLVLSASLAVVAFFILGPAPAAAQLDLEALQDEAVGWLQEYIGINTINPPGN